jgi:hypothetical protein
MILKKEIYKNNYVNLVMILKKKKLISLKGEFFIKSIKKKK